jgi:competence protein ComEA
VTQAERDRIADYLAKNFPRRVNVNKASVQEIRAALEISTQEAEVIVRYRGEKGEFRAIDDLKKVPGLDAAKIESIKARVEF